MSALPWIIGGAAVGVGFLVLRSRKAAQETQTPGACEAIANATGIPQAVCEAGQSVLGQAWEWLTTPSDYGIGEAIARNHKLNGATKIPLRVMPYGFGNAKNTGSVPVFIGDTLEHENGCRPFGSWVRNPTTGKSEWVGGPGWEKCAQGTTGMCPGAQDYKRTNPNGTVVELHPRDYFAGNGADLFTVEASRGHPWFKYFGAPAVAKSNAEREAAAIKVPEGHKAYYVRGIPTTCPPDRVLSSFDVPAGVRDHRTHVEPGCVAPGTSWTSSSSGSSNTAQPSGTSRPEDLVCTGFGPFRVCIPKSTAPATSSGGASVNEPSNRRELLR